MIQHRLTLCGVECAVEEWGTSENPPVILLHGWLDNLGSFEKILPRLSEYRVFALDFPGHGHSDHLPAGMAYHFLDLVYVIQDLVNAFALSNVTIIGHSMGGAAATLFTSVSDKVSSLVLIEALGPLTVSVEGTFELMQKSIRDRDSLVEKTLPVYADAAQALEVRAAHSKMVPEHIKPIVDRGLKSVENGVTWNSDPRLRIASINRLTENQLEPLLKAIHVPVLLIEAEDGIFAKNDVIQQRKEWFQQLQIESLVGGHHVHMEQPEKVAESILTFLKS